MRRFRWRKREAGRDFGEALQGVRQRFAGLQILLEANSTALKLLSDLEEKAQGEFLFDLNYIQSTVSALRHAVLEVVEAMIHLGGEPYVPLRDAFRTVDAQLETLLFKPGREAAGPFVLPLAEYGRDQIDSVGSKNAQLGELRARLGLRVPDGFAITAAAYQHFIDANDLQRRLTRLIEPLDIRQYGDLSKASEAIRALVMESEVPADLASEMQQAFQDLEGGAHAGGYALRSSAIGENTYFSFAGQYRTYLNIRADELIDRYREILASKFTPKAIYYFMSHSFRESDLAMSAGCYAMVDAVASGVVYTRDPLRPADDVLMVNAVFGLGPSVVDGTLTPDVFRVSRDDFAVVKSRIQPKCVRLTMRAGGGVVSEPVSDEEQDQPSIDARQLARLAEVALRIEAHYGTPQDIEWAIDRSGELFFLQTRPLRVVRRRRRVPEPDTTALEVVRRGGVPVCPGAGIGAVYHARTSADLKKVPDTCVLVAPHPFPGLVAVLENVSALVTEVGGFASHMGTLVREYGVPTIMGMLGASRIPAGTEVTVDASSRTVFAGAHEQLVEARGAESAPLEDSETVHLLKDVLALVAPLNLLHPGDPGFTIAACRTFHDITRYSHQKAMQVMFEDASTVTASQGLGLQLDSEIPLHVEVFYLDRVVETQGGDRVIREDALASTPMQRFWDGVKDEGWPAGKRPPEGRRFLPASADRGAFSEDSCAFLSRDYMIVNLRMGYHFMTVEAMCTAEPSKNFIRLQYKHGGMWFERRLRRLRLVEHILGHVGFESASKGDFLDSRIAYLDEAGILERLYVLGRLTLMTKQLDMALSSDGVARWYTQEFMKKLGLEQSDPDHA